MDQSATAERLGLKWFAHVGEVEVVEGASTGTLARMVTQSGEGKASYTTILKKLFEKIQDHFSLKLKP